MGVGQGEWEEEGKEREVLGEVMAKGEEGKDQEGWVMGGAWAVRGAGPGTSMRQGPRRR